MSDVSMLSILSDVNARSVLIGCMLLGATAGVVGSFAFLRKRALLGDALAHSALPGVVIGFLIAGGKNPLALLAGAMVTAWLGAVAVDLISRYSRIKEDTATAISLSVLFAVGIVGLTMVQRHGSAAQAGLDHFLFGHAASLLPSDVSQIAVLALLTMAVLGIFYKEFKATSFDPEFTQSIGIPVTVLNTVMTTLIVLAVVIGLQAVGIVLMAALIITPAAAARLWTDRLSGMIVLAAAIGALAGIAGSGISFGIPRMPTGPWVVLSATGMFFVSLIFAPRRGLLTRMLRYVRVRNQTMQENVLKSFYKIGEQRGDMLSPITPADLQRARFFAPGTFRRGMRRLQRMGWVEQAGAEYRLTDEGLVRAARLVKLHRLWEVYLTDYINLPSDHVHRDAEQIEHVITPELEAELEKLLERPRHDPHGTPIPYEPASVRGATSSGSSSPEC